MKGLFFQQPLEYRLETPVEECHQGSIVQGQFSVKNMGGDAAQPEQVQVMLAYGDFKKIKEKEEEPWKVLDTHVFEEKLTLEPGQQQDFSWQFELPSDCHITDKTGSLFLLYGDQNILQKGGRLDLQVHLAEILKSFLQTFQTQFKFAKKYEKNKEGYIEIKMDPPDSKNYPTLDHLLCHMRLHNRAIEIKYTFKMKAIGRSNSDDAKVVRKNREVIQSLPPEEYLSPAGFPHRPAFQKAIDEALQEARPKAVF